MVVGDSEHPRRREPPAGRLSAGYVALIFFVDFVPEPTTTLLRLAAKPSCAASPCLQALTKPPKHAEMFRQAAVLSGPVKSKSHVPLKPAEACWRGRNVSTFRPRRFVQNLNLDGIPIARRCPNRRQNPRASHPRPPSAKPQTLHCGNESAESVTMRRRESCSLAGFTFPSGYSSP
jgi:hypothetical protein